MLSTIPEQRSQIRPAKQTDCKQLSDLAFRSKAYWGYSDEFMEACRGELTYTVDDLQRDTFYVLVDEGKLERQRLVRRSRGVLTADFCHYFQWT